MQKPAFIDGVYQPNSTVYGQQPARLTWAEDGRIMLVVNAGTADVPQYSELFNVSLGEVQKVSLFGDSVKFTLAQGQYRFSVVRNAGMLTAGGSAIGIAVAQNRYKKSGFDMWLDEFTKQGVNVSRTSYAKLIGVTFAIVFGFIALFIAIGLLLEA